MKFLLHKTKLNVFLISNNSVRNIRYSLNAKSATQYLKKNIRMRVKYQYTYVYSLCICSTHHIENPCKIHVYIWLVCVIVFHRVDNK